MHASLYVVRYNRYYKHFIYCVLYHALPQLAGLSEQLRRFFQQHGVRALDYTNFSPRTTKGCCGTDKARRRSLQDSL